MQYDVQQNIGRVAMCENSGLRAESDWSEEVVNFLVLLPSARNATKASS